MPKSPLLLLGVPAATLLGTLQVFALDLDSNRFPDVWETKYNAASLAPDEDKDGDGATNALEAAAGTNPSDPNSKLALTLDLGEGAGSISFPTVFNFARPTAEPTPLVLYLQISGATDPTNSSASPSDYTLRNGTYEVTNKITIQANSTSVNLTVRAVPDTLAETPEELIVSVIGQTPYAKATFYDARENDASNEKLYVAYLRPMTGVVSNASGLDTHALLLPPALHERNRDHVRRTGPPV